MRVFILGAGFSADAGYPVSGNLFQHLHENQLGMEKLWVNPPSPWKHFESWWTQQSSWLPIFFPMFPALEGVDLELLLTLMDVQAEEIQRRREKMEQLWWAGMRNGTITTPSASEKACLPARNIDDQERDPLRRAREALREALTLLIERLGVETPKSKTSYIRAFVDHLKDRDVVITFNYDVEVEKALIASGRWRPDEGYGLRASILRFDAASGSSPSKVSILKLHGSIGWREGADGGLRLESDLTSFLDPSVREESDSLTPPYEYVNSNRVILEPSYLKHLENSDLAQIWAKAAEALSVSSEVTVVGYSFPQADTAARALIASSLRLRENIPLTIIDTKPAPKLILSRLLSQEVAHLRLTAKEWCETLLPQS